MTILRRIEAMPEWLYWLLLLSMVFFYHVLIGFQGLEMTDEGWLLTGYQQIFSHPGSVESMFYTYNTLLLGGVWNLLFGEIGIVGFRVLAAIVLTGIAAVVYGICRNSINRWVVYFSLLAVMIGRTYLMVLHYNYTSALVVLFIIFVMQKAIERDSLLLVCSAGILTGVGVFFRFPNISFIGIILVLIIHYTYNKDIKRTLSFLIVAITGFIVGIGLNIALIYALGHQEPMQNMLTIVSALSTAEDSSHSLPHLLNTYFNQYREIFCLMGQMVLVAIALWLTGKYEKIRWLKLTIVSIILLLSAVYLLVWYKINYTLGFLYIFGSFAFCYFVYFLSFVQRELFDRQMTYLVAYSTLILLLMPLGSDVGIHNVGAFCLYLPIPVAIGVLDKYFATLGRYQLKYYRRYVFLIGLCVVAASLASMSRNCYRDKGYFRSHMSEKLTFSVVPSTYTSADKVQKVDAVLQAIQPLLTKETELLSYPSAPMLNYLTNTKPYLNGAWIGIMNYSVYAAEFKKAEATKERPIVVLIKSPKVEWYEPNPEWRTVMDCSDWHPAIEEKNILLANFMDKYEYVVYYDDPLFQIQVPNYP